MANNEIVGNQPVSLVKRVLTFGLLAGFLIMGILSMKRAMPQDKEARIYYAIKVHSPYQFEKRLGGLTIVDKRTGTKEKPNASEVLLRADELDKKWAKTHLSIKNDIIIIKKDDNSTARVLIKSQKERTFIKSFFGI